MSVLGLTRFPPFTTGTVVTPPPPSTTGPPTIRAGLNTFEPVNWTVLPLGQIIGCNGLDRGFLWDGRTTSAYDLGIDPPTAAPTITAGSGGGATAGVYLFAYRYVAGDGTGSSFSPLAQLTATDNQKFSWSNLVVSPNARVTNIELYRSTSAEATALYRVAVIDNATTSWAGDPLTDDQLSAEPTATGGVTGNITSSTNSSGKAIFTASASTPLYAGAVVAVTNHSVDAYNQELHTITAASGSDFTSNQSYIADGTGGQWSLQNIPLFTDAANEDYGYRFAPPPNTKSVPIYFQDRLWLGIDVEYTAGVISGTSGEATVTGSTSPIDTAWPSTFVGRYLFPKGDPQGGYKIIKVTDKNTLVLETTLSMDLVSQPYAICPDPNTADEFYFSETGEPESMRATNVVRVQKRTGDCDRWRAMRDVGPALYLFRDRSAYRLMYVAQPSIDVSVSFFGARGCLGARCTALAEGVLYVMDQSGIYRINNSQLDDTIGAPVQDYFRDRKIDFSQTSRFHVAADPIEGVVRFFVVLGGQSVPVALTYNYRLQVWWQESYPWILTGTAMVPVSSRLRRLCGGTTDTMYLMDEGTTDGTMAADGTIEGTIVSATSNGAVLSEITPSDCVGAVIAIISGSAKGVTALIGDGASSNTITTASNWSVVPAAGDTYAIGAISWEMMTGILTLDTDGDRSLRQVHVVFAPTATPTSMIFNLYLNHDPTPQVNLAAPQAGDCVEWIAGDADIVVHMDASYSPQGRATGYARFAFGGHGDDWAQANHFVAIDASGYQVASEVTFFGMMVDGMVTDGA